MPSDNLDLMFLGTGNAFAADGRAFSCFLLNGRYLFDCGPTVLQQLNKIGVSSSEVDLVLVSHFHADHFFGLPFLFMDAWHNNRRKEMTIVGPPGIEVRVEELFENAFGPMRDELGFKRRYIDVADGFEAEAAGLTFAASEVVHVPHLECFAYRADLNNRSIVYSGDTSLCDGLLKLMPGADIVVIECSYGVDPVHLSPDDLAEVRRHAPDSASFIVTHVDRQEPPVGFKGLLIAEDLKRFSF